MRNEKAGTRPGRIALGLLGFLGGLSAWILIEILPDHMTHAPHALLALTSFAAAFFAAALAVAGPLSLSRAVTAALALALPLSGLMTWASHRFDSVGAFLDSAHPWTGVALLWFLPLPFLIAALKPTIRWNDYRELFDESWMVVVRLTSAWLFVGLVWGVLFLSNALLELVGLDIIERLLEREEVPYLLTGVTLGIALAVVGELSDYVSADLILRLLRLLLPVVLVVVAVFLGALPFRGLSNLFGEFSAAAILLAIAFGAATLISTGIDTGAADRGPGRLTLWSCRLMALLLPALAVLAGAAIWLRTQQYGLTPDRVIAAALAALALGYGAAYAAAVLLGRGWEARIRRANIAMALVVIGSIAAFFTPLLNPQAISAANQVARYQRGAVDADGLDLWTMAHDWGRPGAAVIEQLATIQSRPDAERLATRLDALAEAESRYAFERTGEGDDVAALAESLVTALPVRPDGATLPDGLLGSLRLWELQQIARACAARTPAGNPGCIALLADFSGARPGDEVLVVAQVPGGAPMLRAYFRTDGSNGFSMRNPDYISGDAVYRDANALIDALMAGTYRLTPVPLNALDVDGRRLFFGR